jgi:Innexin
LLAKFIAFGNIGWGMLIISGMIKDEESSLFPRVTFCDFDVQEMGNLQKHTVKLLIFLIYKYKLRFNVF